MNIITSIRVLKPTLNRLKEMGKKEETYDQIINRLIDLHEKTEKQDK